VRAMTRSPAVTEEPVAEERPTRWIGWVVFAGLVMLAGGVLNVMQGLVALLDEEHYAATTDLAITMDYQVWGWLLVAFGALVAVAGYAVLSGRTWARVVAVVVLALDALVNFVFVAGYPFWSVIAIVLDVIVIHALVVHGREARIIG
jgi:hypothetical protein